MGIQPSGESTSMTREEYLRVRDRDSKKPDRKRAIKKRQSLTWGSE